jgi:DNA-binding response OmpR family regulator
MDYQKKTILIVEDEEAILSLLSDKLTQNGFEIIQATNGLEGLNFALQKHPDLILVDILMPKIDGMTMLQKLRTDSWGQTIPVIILTNVNPDNNQTLEDINKTHPAYYFVKSDIKLDEVAEKVKEILSSSKTE